MTPFERFSLMAARDPHFFGSQLAAFATRRLWTNAALAQWLGTAPATLAHLRLCRALYGEEDVAAVAAKFGIDEVKLAEVLAG